MLTLTITEPIRDIPYYERQTQWFLIECQIMCFPFSCVVVFVLNNAKNICFPKTLEKVRFQCTRNIRSSALSRIPKTIERKLTRNSNHFFENLNKYLFSSLLVGSSFTQINICSVRIRQL